MRILIFCAFIIACFQSSLVFGDEWKQYVYGGNDLGEIAVNGDSVWCVTSGDLTRWSKKDSTCVHYTINDGFHSDNVNYIQKMLVDGEGNPWFACHKSNVSSIWRFDGVSTKVYDTVGYDIPKAVFSDAFRDSRGNLWFSTHSDGVGRYDGSSWKTFRKEETFSGVQAVVCDARGSVWLGANGLWTYEGGDVRPYLADDAPSSTVTVQCIVTGPDSVMWVGTVKGLYRFNGSEWKHYTASDGLVSNNITVIVPDGTGGVWVGTPSGASHFDGAIWKSFKEADGMISNKVTGIALASDGTVWFSHGTADMGVTVYNGSKLVWYTTYNTTIPTNEVRYIASDSNGVVWCATSGGAMSWENGEWRKIDVPDGLQSTDIKKVTIDELNRPWFLYTAAANLRATCYDNGIWKTYTTADGLPSDSVSLVYAQADGVLWFGAGESVSRFDGNVRDVFPKRDCLLTSIIYGVTEDAAGVVWFATFEGLSRYDGTSWRTYTTDDGLPVNEVRAVQCTEDGCVWCLCDWKLWRFDGTTFTNYPIPVDAGIPSTFSYSISRLEYDKKSGELWTDTKRRLPDENGEAVYGGFWCFSDGKWVEKTGPDPNEYDGVMICDGAGTLWYSTKDGLKSYDGASVRSYRVNGPTRTGFDAIICDNNNCKWFFDHQGYVECFDGAAWSVMAKDKDYPTINTIDNIFCDSDNTMWYSRPSGIYSLAGSTETLVIPSGNFPVDETIQNFVQDGEGAFWITFSPSRALYRYDGDAWTRITTADGLLSDKMQRLYVDKKGVVWAKTDQGLYRYDGGKWCIFEFTDSHIFNFDMNNNVWFSIEEGIFKSNGENWISVLKIADVPDEMLFQKKYLVMMGVDNNGVVWFRTSTGIASYNGSGWKTYTTADGLWGTIAYSMTVDKENLKWFIASEGVFSLDDRTESGGEAGPALSPLSLRGNYPNPFNAGTSIEFTLASWSRVDITIYNIMGQKVRTLSPGKMAVGRHSVLWDGADGHGTRVSSGPYFYRVENLGHTSKGRMMLVK